MIQVSARRQSRAQSMPCRPVEPAHMEALYGGYFRQHVQPMITDVADRMSRKPRPDRWRCFELTNGGCYMVPLSNQPFHIWYADETTALLSPDAFGLTVTVHALALLRFSGPVGFPETCTKQHRLLCQCARTHPEWPVLRHATY